MARRTFHLSAALCICVATLCYIVVCCSTLWYIVALCIHVATLWQYSRVLDYTAIKTHVRITGAHGGGGGGVVYKWGGGRGDSIDSIPMSSDLLCCPDRTSNLT